MVAPRGATRQFRVQARFFVLILEKTTPSVQAAGRLCDSIHRRFGRESPTSSAAIMDAIVSRIKIVLSEAEEVPASDVTPRQAEGVNRLVGEATSAGRAAVRRTRSGPIGQFPFGRLFSLRAPPRPSVRFACCGVRSQLTVSARARGP